MKRVSKLMQEIQTALVKAGMSKKVAVTFTEHRVAHVCQDETTSVAICHRLKKTLADAEAKSPRVISGGFIWLETPEGHGYWNDLAVSLGW